jgi:hypothetical protein
MKSPYRLLSLLLFLALFLFVVLTFQQAGIAWDEQWHLEYGRLLFDYYRGQPPVEPELSALTYRNLYIYGGAFDLSAELFTRLFGRVLPYGALELRHLFTGLVGLLGVAGAWLAARRLAGERAAFWSALLLALWPGYLGHLFFNPKDLPFAAAYIWGLYALLRLLDSPARAAWRDWLFFGLVAGLALGVRVGGVALFGCAFLVLAWNAWHAWRETGRLDLRDLPAFAAAGLLAYAVMLACWPWAQQAPLRNPLEALQRMSNFNFPYEVLYNGAFISAIDLPRAYLPHYLLVTLPELLLALLAIGAALGLRQSARLLGGKGLPSPAFAGGLLLMLASLLPAGFAIWLGSTLYDGTRHFLFIFPPLAVLAGWTFDWLLARLAAWRGWAVRLALGLAALYLGWLAWQMAVLHPYQYTYYNQFAGGLRGAAARFETDYWGTAASAAARQLPAALLADGWPAGQTARLAVAGANDFSVRYYLPDWIVYTPDPDEADVFIGGMRGFGMDQFEGRVIFSIDRQGVPFAVVKRPEK